MKLAALLVPALLLCAQAQAQPRIVLDGQYSLRTDEMSLEIVKRRATWHLMTLDLALNITRLQDQRATVH